MPNWSLRRPTLEKSSLFAVALSVLTCATCPFCVTAYAGLASMLGVGFAIGSEAHGALVLVSVAATLAVIAWGKRRTQSWMPLLGAVFGAVLVICSELELGGAAIEYGGFALLMLGSLGNLRAKKLPVDHPAVSGPHRCERC
jgi:hypothetical protein